MIGRSVLPSTRRSTHAAACGLALCSLLFAATSALPAHGQESPYIVTYDHYLEEPGSLEVEYFSTVGTQRGGNDFHAFWTEFEYGATAWWTTELYLDGQTTFNDSTLFTGFRWGNRLRPLAREHFINPVIYIEYEQISEADKILKEVEGHDVESDYADPNPVLRQEHDHELEFKLLLSKTFKGWNVAVNPLATKNLSPSNPWEFGYALGVSRPLALKASPHRCNWCRENFVAGVELYGCLGNTQVLGLPETSHYLAPVMAWNLPADWTVRLSAGFGLNDNSHRLLLRWGLSREFSGFGEGVRRLLGRPPMKIAALRPTVAVTMVMAGLPFLAALLARAQTQGLNAPNPKWNYAALAEVPAKARARRNPLNNDLDAVAAGRKLFEQHCLECHGPDASGTTRGPSLRVIEVQQAEPGTLFFVLTNGVIRRGMPEWSKLPEPQRWQIVSFLESLRE